MDLSISCEVVSNTSKVPVSFRKVLWRCFSVFVVLEMVQRPNSITLFLKGKWYDFNIVLMDMKLGLWRERDPLLIGKLMEWLGWSFGVGNFDLTWVRKWDKSKTCWLKMCDQSPVIPLSSTLFCINDTFGEKKWSQHLLRWFWIVSILGNFSFWQLGFGLLMSLCYTHLGLNFGVRKCYSACLCSKGSETTWISDLWHGLTCFG